MRCLDFAVPDHIDWVSNDCFFFCLKSLHQTGVLIVIGYDNVEHACELCTVYVIMWLGFGKNGS